jgi:hypothetical protein
MLPKLFGLTGHCFFRVFRIPPPHSDILVTQGNAGLVLGDVQAFPLGAAPPYPRTIKKVYEAAPLDPISQQRHALPGISCSTPSPNLLQRADFCPLRHSISTTSHSFVSRQRSLQSLRQLPRLIPLRPCSSPYIVITHWVSSISSTLI